MTNAIVPNLTIISAERSNYISRIGHDADFLFVEFRRDASLFRFDEVSESEYKALMDAPSLGEHFSKTIKGVKPYKRMDTAHAIERVMVDDGSLAAMVREQAQRALAFEVRDVASHTVAQEALHKLAKLKERVIQHHADTKKKTYEAWKSICHAERSLLDPLEEADAVLRKKVGEFTYAQLKRAEEEDKARRLEAEQEAIARAMKESEETALRAAMELEASGDHEGAEAVLAHPAPSEVRYEMPPPVRPEVAKVEGITGSIVYEVSIHDVSMVPRSFLVIDVARTEAEIARRAKQAGGRLQVAGVTIRETYAPRRAGGRR